MQFIVASIFCNIGVSILLKLAHGARVDIRQSFLVNYVIGMGLCLLLLPTFSKPLPEGASAWFVLTVLSLLLPSVFLAMAHAVQQAGIARSDAAQRLSLIISLFAAFSIFGEALTAAKAAGVAAALIALLLFLRRSGDTPMQAQRSCMSLLVVWLGYGLADVLFKFLALTGTAFLTSLLWVFGGSSASLLVYLLLKRTRWQHQSLRWGLPLGLLNFGNIYFYLRAHQHFAHSPAVVFATMNAGIVVAGIAVGALGFGETWQRRHSVGALFTVLAIALLGLALG